MAKKIIAVGLKKLEYGVIGAEGALPVTWLDIDVVHDDTFEYQMGEATYQEYINMITKKPYYKEKTAEGERSLNFSIGKYDLETKAKFMGGTYTPATASDNEKWESGTPSPIYLAFRATTVDDVQITFPKGDVAANHTKNLNALGLTLKVTPLEPDSTTLKDEIWEVLGTKTA